jgi:hypothetical protein
LHSFPKILITVLLFTACQQEKYPIEPIDKLTPPANWFLLGILPNPAKKRLLIRLMRKLPALQAWQSLYR